MGKKQNKQSPNNQGPEQKQSNTPSNGGVVASDNGVQPITPEVLTVTTGENGKLKIFGAQQFIGPLPPPHMLKEYNEVHPELGQTIVNSYVKEGDHRRAMDLKNHELDALYLREAISDSRRGSWLAFVLCVLAITGGVYAAVNGAQFAGGAIGVTGLAGLVYAFKSGVKLPPVEPQRRTLSPPDEGKKKPEKPDPK